MQASGSARASDIARRAECATTFVPRAKNGISGQVDRRRFEFKWPVSKSSTFRSQSHEARVRVERYPSTEPPPDNVGIGRNRELLRKVTSLGLKLWELPLYR
jgi:hypothetical protein